MSDTTTPTPATRQRPKKTSSRAQQREQLVADASDAKAGISRRGDPVLVMDAIIGVETGLFFIGGLDDPEHRVERFGLMLPGKPGVALAFSPANPALSMCLSVRADLTDPVDPVRIPNLAANGFVVFLKAKHEQRMHPKVQMALQLHDGQVLAQDCSVTWYERLDRGQLERFWTHSGPLLLNLAETVLGAEHPLTLTLCETDERQRGGACPGLLIDQALHVESSLLCLYGWSPSPARLVRRLALVTASGLLDLDAGGHRIARPDLASVFPALQGERFGLLALVLVTPEALASASLYLETITGQVTVLPLRPQAVDWPHCLHLLRPFWIQVLGDLPALIQESYAQGYTPLAQYMAALATELLRNHQAMQPHLTTEATEHGFFALDRAWGLDAAGVLLMGWRFDPCGLGARVYLHAAGGQTLELSNHLFPVPRPDVVQAYRNRFADIPEETGFVCWAPLPTTPGSTWLIELRRPQQPSQWLRLPDYRSTLSGVALVRDVLSWVPQPQRLRPYLYALFDAHLGPALTVLAPIVSAARQHRLSVLEFGAPVSQPQVSVLVPLYKRYDFMRHQLAQFADDPDFQRVDLLYLIDDPGIFTETLDLASAIQELFGIPFRIAHAGANLGFAAINNLGAQLARAEHLLLLNSDVIPLQPGWLGILLEQLHRLPEAGAVAPLLLFAEGAVQHAGMVIGGHPKFPGFMFNLHPGKGQYWSGPDQPIEQDMLTAACLLLRSADYWACNGLDEGYRIGDFEDGDLCLALRQRGKHLYLVPTARLCHLERQSQQLTGFGDMRMLLTLYNSWRFGDKIRSGQLPDPRCLLKD